MVAEDRATEAGLTHITLQDLDSEVWNKTDLDLNLALPLVVWSCANPSVPFLLLLNED